eukprot:691045-Amorphochlora_amoeboformis.AAC.1
MKHLFGRKTLFGRFHQCSGNFRFYRGSKFVFDRPGGQPPDGCQPVEAARKRFKLLLQALSKRVGMDPKWRGLLGLSSRIR